MDHIYFQARFQPHLLFLFVTTSCILVQTAICQSVSNMTVNGTLVASKNQTLVSPGGIFALGFYAGTQSSNGGNYNPIYALAIWYVQSPKTVVWMADRSMNLSSSANLLLTAQGLQVYSYGNNLSAQPIWSSQTTKPSIIVSKAAMLDTGNLVLLNANNQVLWQSFDTPTNTLLPGQLYKASSNITMYAWQDSGNWTQSRYYLNWSTDGTLGSYYRTPFANPSSLNYDRISNSNFTYTELTADGQLIVSYNSQNNATIGTSSDMGASKMNPLRRFVIDSDGNFRIYSWVTTSSTAYWNATYIGQQNLCDIYNYCGDYGICSYTTLGGPVGCTCPKGFQAASNDSNYNATVPNQGCQRTEALIISSSSTTTSSLSTCNISSNGTSGSNVTTNTYFNQFESVDYSYQIDITSYQSVNVSFCEQKCLALCTCVAFVISLPDVSTGVVDNCWLKDAPLLDGQRSPRQGQKRTTYLQFSNYNATNNGSRIIVGGGLSREEKLSIGIITLGAMLLMLAGVLCVIVGLALIQKHKSSRFWRLEAKWVASKGVTISFTFKEVRLMTRDFAEEIGRGGHGSVFKGEVVVMGRPGRSAGDETHLVAVKRLDKLGPRDDEFVNEVNTVGCIHHVNLVKLHGYCVDATAPHNQKFLVYEYVKNSSLDKALFSRPSRGINSGPFRKPSENTTSAVAGWPILEWRSRFRIAIETARGLAYLHEGVRDQRIIHCDIKPENILLDTKMSAKVADFGLSRIMRRDQTRTMTMNMRGTCGYMAPEWTSPNTPITVKIDVYSYGMVLLEIVSGRRNLKTSCIIDDDLDEGPESVMLNILDAPDFYYPEWAFEKLGLETDASILEVVDPSLTGVVNVEEVRRALLVAFWCINHKPEQRPTMSKVAQMLEGDIPIHRPVPRPGILDELHPGSLVRGQGSSNLFDSSDLLSASESHSTLFIRRYSAPSSSVASHDNSKNPTSIESQGELSSNGSIFNGR